MSVFSISRVGEVGLLLKSAGSHKFLMVGAVRRGQRALASPVQLLPVPQPTFPWCTVFSAFLIGNFTAAVGLLIWLFTLD